MAKGEFVIFLNNTTFLYSLFSLEINQLIFLVKFFHFAFFSKLIDFSFSLIKMTQTIEVHGFEEFLNALSSGTTSLIGISVGDERLRNTLSQGFGSAKN